MTTRINVRNLRFTTRPNDIYDVFKDFGEIVECHLVTDKNNESRGYAFISYTNLYDADVAVQSMNKKRFDGSIIQVSIAKNQELMRIEDPELQNIQLPNAEPERKIGSATNWERHYYQNYKKPIYLNNSNEDRSYERNIRPLSNISSSHRSDYTPNRYNQPPPLPPRFPPMPPPLNASQMPPRNLPNIPPNPKEPLLYPKYNDLNQNKPIRVNDDPRNYRNDHLQSQSYPPPPPPPQQRQPPPFPPPPPQLLHRTSQNSSLKPPPPFMGYFEPD